MVVTVAPEKFLLMWGIYLVVPPATVIALLRGRLEDEPHSYYRRRVWIGAAVSVAAWYPVASTIAVPDYFTAFRWALEETSIWAKTWLVLDAALAIGIVGLPRSIRSRFDPDTSLYDDS